MLELFDAFDNTLNLNISFGLKYGILLNGNSSSGSQRQTFLSKLESHLRDAMKDMTGIEEIDGRRAEEAKDEDEQGRLHGAVEIAGYIGDTYVRRYVQEG